MLALATGLILFGLPLTTSAHTLKTDGNIGGLLHVDPTDEPFANAPSTIYFELTNKSAHITPAKCECQMVVKLGGKQLSTQALYPEGSNSLETKISYTFPEPGVYQLKFLGSAGTEQFSLSFDVRVQPAAQLTSNGESENHTGHYVIFGAGGLFLLGYMLYSYKRKSIVTK
jgi:hypothetical protein